MDYAERYVVELEDGTFALWGQFVDGETQSILAMDEFCNGTLLRKENAERKIEQINKGVWKALILRGSIQLSHILYSHRTLIGLMRTSLYNPL